MRMKSFEFEGVTVTPGTIGKCEIEVGSDALGREMCVNIHIVHGTSPGPVVACIGTIHGDELNGMAIIHHLITGPDHLQGTGDDVIDPDLLRGTLILVPIANPSAVLRGTRQGADGHDLNRMFPGKKKGKFTQRLAHTLFHRIVDHCDMIVDLHSAPSSRLNVPHLRANLDDPGSRKMAGLFGLQITLHSVGAEGTLRRTAVDSGIPAVLLEAGTSHRFEPEMIRLGVRGLLEMFAGLEMLPPLKERAAVNLMVRRSRWVRANCGGILHASVDGGELVDKGQTLAQIVDPLGIAVSSIQAPVSGIVIGLATHPLVHSGDPVANIVMLDEIQRTLLREHGVEGRIDAALDTNYIEVSDEDGLTIDDQV